MVLGFRSFLCAFVTLFALQGLAKTQVYFNHDDRVSYLDPYRQIERPGHNFEQIVVDFIETAQESIEVAVQEFRISRIAEALVKKHKSGVTVRVVIDDSYNSRLPQIDFELRPFIDIERAIDILITNGIDLSDDTAGDNGGHHLMHHKFLVVDKKRVLVTSSNFTLRDFHGPPNSPESLGNANAMLVIDEPEIAKVFLREFNYMFGSIQMAPPEKRTPLFGQNKPHRGAYDVMGDEGMIRIQFAPTSRLLPQEETTIGLIEREIADASESLDLALFVFSDQTIADRLKALKNRSVIRLSVLIEKMFAFRAWSKGMDLLGLQLLSTSCEYSKNSFPWAVPVERVGVPIFSGVDKLHHKFAIVDGKKVIFGSKNWTEAATYNNDETVMVIEDESVAKEFLYEYHRMERNAHWGPLPWVKERIREREEKCS